MGYKKSSAVKQLAHNHQQHKGVFVCTIHYVLLVVLLLLLVLLLVQKSPAVLLLTSRPGYVADVLLLRIALAPCIGTKSSS